MHVKMGDFLTRVATLVDDQPESRIRYTLIISHLLCGQKQVAKHNLMVGGRVRQVRKVLVRND